MLRRIGGYSDFGISNQSTIDGLQDEYDVAERLMGRGILTFDEALQQGDALGESQTSTASYEAMSFVSVPAEELKVKFEVIGNRVALDGNKKYVLYTIIVMDVSKLDTDKAIIERRYTDFYRLHKGLRESCNTSVQNITFPKKEFFGNFASNVVEMRSRKFEEYLCYIYHQQCVGRSLAFREFFYLPHLRRATEHLNSEDYEQASSEYLVALCLQRKLQDTTTEIVRTLCSLAEVCKSLHKYVEADKFASDALELITENDNSDYVAPLLTEHIALRRQLYKDCTVLEERVRECRIRGVRFDEGIPTLRELSCTRF